jgi:flagellar protein FliS
VALLLSGARERLNMAQAFMQHKRHGARGRVIGEACSIIGHLSGSLDHEAGGDIATGLASLYDYMQVRLTEANLHNDPVPLDECMTLLGEIESAWNAIPAGQRRPAPTPRHDRALRLAPSNRCSRRWTRSTAPGRRNARSRSRSRRCLRRRPAFIHGQRSRPRRASRTMRQLLERQQAISDRADALRDKSRQQQSRLNRGGQAGTRLSVAGPGLSSHGFRPPPSAQSQTLQPLKSPPRAPIYKTSRRKARPVETRS